MGAAENSKPTMSVTSKENYYTLLGLSASASALEIRRAYREMSKLYHPDTTKLPQDEAKERFQQLTQAYNTLNDPMQRQLYDQQQRSARLRHLGQTPGFSQPPGVWGVTRQQRYSSAYIDATDRPLSTGEIVALLLMALTLVGCLLLAVAIGLTRGEAAFQPPPVPTITPAVEESIPDLPSNVNLPANIKYYWS